MFLNEAPKPQHPEVPSYFRGSHIFLKGAPEVVKELCDPASLPPNFSQVVHGLTKQGLRILACAHRYKRHQ